METCSTSQTRGTVCVCGAGNAAHVFVPFLVSNGFTVTVFADFGDEAERFQQACTENGGVEVYDRRDPTSPRSYKASPAAVSRKAEEVVPQADYVILSLPAFALRSVLTGLKGHLKSGAIIYIMPGQGGADYVAKEVLGPELRAGEVAVAGVMPMPVNCRIDTFGKRVQLAAFKSCYDLAAVPPAMAPKAAEVLSEVLGGRAVRPLGNYAAIHMHTGNPNIHPPRLYSLFSQHTDGKVYPENPLFYEDWDDVAEDLAQRLCDERRKVWASICEQRPAAGSPEDVPTLKGYLEAIYAGQIKDSSSLKSIFRTNDGYKGFRCPMKEVPGGWTPDFTNRYFLEDLPGGVAVYKGIAELAGVATPTIDQILELQGFLGKEYIKDGMLQGRDVGETMAPQRFGITTLDALLEI